MTFAPLSLGGNADPIRVPSAQDKENLLGCGALDLPQLNGILKLLGDRIDAVDAEDNRVISGNYNPATNVLLLTMAEGETVEIDMTALLADAVATVSVVPVGVVVMWSGAIGAVPAGWALCDGSGGTPDLRDRFVVGAGNSYVVGATGGASQHNHGGATGGHALTIAQMPAHAHGNSVGDNLTSSFVRGSQAAASATNMNNDSSAGTVEGLTESIGGGLPHNHSIDNADHIPPYFALAYIIKI